LAFNSRQRPLFQTDSGEIIEGQGFFYIKGIYITDSLKGKLAFNYNVKCSSPNRDRNNVNLAEVKYGLRKILEKVDNEELIKRFIKKGEINSRKEENVTNILPRLKLLEGLAGSSKSEASILRGVPTFMNLLYGLLEYKQPIYVYGIPKVAPETLRLYIMDFHKERSKRKIQMDHIYNYDAAERIKILRKLSFTNARSLPKSVESGASTLICGPEIHVQVWTENNVKIIRIKDEEIAKSYMNYFKFMWELAK